MALNAKKIDMGKRRAFPLEKGSAPAGMSGIPSFFAGNAKENPPGREAGGQEENRKFSKEFVFYHARIMPTWNFFIKFLFSIYIPIYYTLAKKKFPPFSEMGRKNMSIFLNRLFPSFGHPFPRGKFLNFPPSSCPSSAGRLFPLGQGLTGMEKALPIPSP